MTAAQFAIAVGADQMWIRNARRALGRPRRTDAIEAHWFGLVHDLHVALGVALRDAARVATEAVAASSDQRSVEFVADRIGSIGVTVDLSRTRFLHELRLASATYLPVLDHRGRPATSYRATVAELARRARRGSDPIRLALSAKRPAAERLAALGSMAELLLGLVSAEVRFIAIDRVAGALLGTLRQPSAVDVLLDVSNHASLDALARQLTKWRARPRGADGGQPRPIDAALITAVPAMALDTDLGPLNLWAQRPGIGNYTQAQERAISGDASGFPFPVLGLEALTAMERSSGRSRDHELLYELRQLGSERKRAARLENYRRSISSSCATTFV